MERIKTELELQIMVLEKWLEEVKSDGEEAIDTIKHELAGPKTPETWTLIDTRAIINAAMTLVHAQERYKAMEAQISAFKQVTRAEGV